MRDSLGLDRSSVELRHPKDFAQWPTNGRSYLSPNVSIAESLEHATKVPALHGSLSASVSPIEYSQFRYSLVTHAAQILQNHRVSFRS